MKKTILSISLFTIAVGSAMFITSCSKDTTAPLITVAGSTTVNQQLGDAYVDAGATATDDKDGTVTVTNDESTTNPNVDVAGTYTIHYTATDKAGNVGTASRTVIIEIRRANYLFTYNATEVCPSGTFSYSGGITAGATSSGVNIYNFSGSLANCTATVSGANITLSSSSYGTFTNVSGTGTINDTGSVITITYTSTNTANSTTETCTVTLTKI